MDVVSMARLFVGAFKGDDQTDWPDLRKERHGAASVIVALAAERDELLAFARDIHEWTAEGPLILSAVEREKLAALLSRIG